MANVEDIVKRQIGILKRYVFFTDFMDSDAPDNEKFQGELKLFSTDPLIKQSITKKELNVLKHLGFLSTYPKEKRYAMLERWLTAELTSEFISIKVVKNPLSKDLKEFYQDIYQNAFTEDEQAPLKDFRRWIVEENWFPSGIIHLFDSRFYKNIYGHVVHPRYYLIIAKIKGVVVGGAIVNTINTQYTSFAVVEYILIILQHLNEIEGLKEFNTSEYKVKLAIALFERCKHYAVKDAVRYGHKQPFFILGEVNDPVKMHEKGILNREHDVENPVLRLRLYSILGFRFLNFNYMQPKLSGETEVVDYLYLMIYPLSLDWRSMADPQQLNYALVTYLGTWEGVDVTIEPVKGLSAFLDNLSRAGKKIRLMNFKDLGIPPKIINACKEINWKIEEQSISSEVVKLNVRGKNLYLEPLSYTTLNNAINLVNKIFPEQGIERADIAFRLSLGLEKEGPKGYVYRKLLHTYGVTDLHYWVVVDYELRKVVGTIGLYSYKKDQHEADWVGWMCVAPEYRNYGIGSKTLDSALAKAKSRGKRYLRLYTSTYTNEKIANLLYDKYGFKITRRERIRGTPFEYLYREKELR